jgi:hypothetical protein
VDEQILSIFEDSGLASPWVLVSVIVPILFLAEPGPRKRFAFFYTDPAIQTEISEFFSRKIYASSEKPKAPKKKQNKKPAKNSWLPKAPLTPQVFMKKAIRRIVRTVRS